LSTEKIVLTILAFNTSSKVIWTLQDSPFCLSSVYVKDHTNILLLEAFVF